MTPSGLRRSADVILVVAAAGVIVYIAMVEIRAAADWRPGLLLWPMMDRMLGGWMFAVRMLCIVVMAHAAIRALTTGQRPTRLVWAALVIALCGSLITPIYGYFSWDLETPIPATVLNAATIVLVFLLARLVIPRAGSGRKTGDGLRGEEAATTPRDVLIRPAGAGLSEMTPTRVLHLFRPSPADSAGAPTSSSSWPSQGPWVT